MAKKVPAPSPPYVGPPRWSGGSNNKPIARIVIHCTAGSEPGVKGAARATARYSKNTSRPSSWHYCADALESVQLTWDSVVAYHCGYNRNSIGYELSCSLANEGQGHWAQADHQQMMDLAAEEVAQLCLAYDVPIRWMTVAETRAGQRGICGHDTIRDAFPGSTTHWDPGPHFPRDDFIRRVKLAAARYIDDEPEPPTPDEPDLPGIPIIPRRERVTVATLNIKKDLPAAKMCADVSRVPRLGSIVMLQEIETKAAKNAVAALQGMTVTHIETECPIVFKSYRFELLDSGKVVTHEGMAKVSPHRVVTWVLLRERETGAIFVVANTHMVSGAWNAKRKLGKLWRKDKWLEHHGDQSSLLAEFHAAGHTVIGGGDHNRIDLPKFHEDMKWINKGGIDDLYFIRGPRDQAARVKVISRRTIPASKLHTDHPAKIGTLRIRPTLGTPPEVPAGKRR